MGRNFKADGEKGQAISIGELSKWNIIVCLPMSDNLPFDFISIYNNQLYKTQVKSSAYCSPKAKGSIQFDMRSNNWNKKTIKKYTSEEIDIMILCDYSNIFLLEKHEWEDIGTFTIRYNNPKNGQNNCHMAENYIISEKRIKKVFGEKNEI